MFSCRVNTWYSALLPSCYFLPLKPGILTSRAPFVKMALDNWFLGPIFLLSRHYGFLTSLLPSCYFLPLKPGMYTSRAHFETKKRNFRSHNWLLYRYVFSFGHKFVTQPLLPQAVFSLEALVCRPLETLSKQSLAFLFYYMIRLVTKWSFGLPTHPMIFKVFCRYVLMVLFFLIRKSSR